MLVKVGVKRLYSLIGESAPQYVGRYRVRAY
nr:MAG TPA: hypothetical protein [Caudoviricetes sp.]